MPPSRRPQDQITVPRIKKKKKNRNTVTKETEDTRYWGGARWWMVDICIAQQ
jgi:hypothetical protein